MSMLRIIFAAVVTLALLVAVAPQSADAQEHAPAPPRQKWSFWGPFGVYDQAQLQRGFKVYREVCSTCHSLSLVSFRNLGEPGALGYSEAQIKQLASEYQVKDGPNEQGEMFERPGRPADRFPPAPRFPSGTPPDLSVIAKARTYERGFPWFVFDAITQYQEQGVDYIVAYLTGYEDKLPQGVTVGQGLYYNKYFPGFATSMPKPMQLYTNAVSYDDGTPTTPEQYAKDVAAFLMWAAEPHLVARKRIGLQVMVFLIVFAGLLYFTKQRVWSNAKVPA